MTAVKKAEILGKLQTEILRLQGMKPKENSVDLGLNQLKEAFPEGSLPLAAVHEFLTASSEDFACTRGFVSVLLGALMGNNGTAVWISQSQSVFPPGLTTFGIQPDRIIFIT